MTKELIELDQWKVGNPVVIYSNYSESIQKITRITDGRSGTIYVGDSSFDIYGSLRGCGKWNSGHIKIAVEDDFIRIRGKNAIIRLTNFDWRKLDSAKAIEIEKLLNDNGIVTKPTKPLTT